MGIVQGIVHRVYVFPLVRFVFWGAVSNLVYVGGWAILMYGCHLWYPTASLLASFPQIAVKLLPQKVWTFGNRESPLTRAQFFAYWRVELIFAVLNAVMLPGVADVYHLERFHAQVVVFTLLALPLFLIERPILKSAVVA